MSIQRLDVIGDGWECEFPCDDGDYVKYSDHVKHIEELEVDKQNLVNERNDAWFKIEELEKALGEVSRIADFPPVDKIISELARQALNKK